MKPKQRSENERKPGLQPDRLIDSKPLIIAGLRGRFTDETRNDIPKLWARFAPYLGRVPAQVGGVAYGLCWCPNGDAFDYLAGMEVSAADGLPADFEVVRLPAQQYAVFSHPGHVSTLCQTLDAIHEQWSTHSGENPTTMIAGSVGFFERYGERFDPSTGMGDIEVWVAVEAPK